MLKELLKTSNKQIFSNSSVLYLLLIFLLFGVCSYIFIGHQGHLYIDCGREAYIPSEMIKGEVLYKDIFNVYGPLSYQINAFLYKIFGENLSILYGAGMLNALLILFATFFISKNYTNNLTSFAVTLFIMTTCVFNTYIFNYIFPYSFAISYALCAFLFSVLCLIYYNKNSKVSFAIWSCFFAGISICSKQDFAIYALFLAIYLTIIKPLSKKNILYSIISFFSIPAISFIALLVQGLNINDITTYLQTMKAMLSTQTLKFFYSHFTGLYPTTETLQTTATSFFATGFCLSALLILTYIIKTIKKHKFTHKLELNVIRWILIMLIMLGIWGILGSVFKCVTQTNAFSWLPISNALIFTGFITYFSKVFLSTGVKSLTLLKEFIKNIEPKDKAYILLSLIGVLSSIKSFYALNILIYGPFMLPIVLITNVIFAAEYLSKIFIFLDANIWRKTVATVLIGISILFSAKYSNYALTLKDFKIETSKGFIYSDEDLGRSHEYLLNYINEHLSKSSKILVMPEGHMINFLSDRRSNNNLHSLIPLYVETFGEEKIIEELKQNPPEYIFINNRNSSDYGQAYFCKDYGQKICTYIFNNYAFELQVGNQFKTAIYKHQ